MPAAITLIQRHVTALAEVPLVQWVADNQTEIQVCVAFLVVVAYIAYAPYKYQRANDLIKSPRFEIECGEQTTIRNGIYREQRAISDLQMEVTETQIAFFGFRLWNRGAKLAKGCRVFITGIEKDGVRLCSDIAALGFEADNRGGDLEMVDAPNDVPQRLAVFSVFHDGVIAAGAANMKWRHPPITNYIKDAGTYEFLVSISFQSDGEETLTQKERFTCHWRGTHLTTVIEYRGTNTYTPPN